MKNPDKKQMSYILTGNIIGTLVGAAMATLMPAPPIVDITFMGLWSFCGTVYGISEALKPAHERIFGPGFNAF